MIFELSGSVDDWSVDGTVALSAAGVDDGSFEIRGGGNRDGAEVSIIEGRMLGGTLAGTVAYSWRGANPWSLALDIENLQSAPLYPAWAATLSGGVTASGERTPFAIDLDLRDIEGTFLESPVTANGRIGLGSQRSERQPHSIFHMAARKCRWMVIFTARTEST